MNIDIEYESMNDVLSLGPEIGQVFTSADRHTLNRFQSV